MSITTNSYPEWQVAYQEPSALNGARILLPFVRGVHVPAIEYAVQFAAMHHARLVPLLLWQGSHEGRGDVSLDMVMQASDFTSIIKRVASRHHVEIELTERSGDVLDTILTVTDEMACENILVFVSADEDILMTREQVKELMDTVSCPLYLVAWPSKKGAYRAAFTKFFVTLAKHAMNVF